MANNIFIGPNAVVAKAAGNFVDAGISGANTTIIYRVAASTVSYKPGRAINGVTSFEEGKGYYLIAKQNMDLEAFLIPPVTEAPADDTPTADAFITAVNGAGGTLSTGQQNALKAFDSAMQSGNLWTKMYAVYPFASAIAGGQKFNMKNALDTNGAFRLSFSGGVSASDGYTTDGIDDFADTHFVPSANMSVNNVGMSLMFKNVSIPALGTSGSATADAPPAQHQVYINSSGSSGFSLGSSAVDGAVAFTNPASFHNVLTGVRRGAADAEAYVNGVSVATNTTTITPALSAVSSLIGARQNQLFASEVPIAATFQFYAEHQALSDTEVANLNNAVKALVSGLGR